jgi:hypothetical protein
VAASLACVVSLRELFSTGFQDWGDSAVNSLSVDRALHLDQIRGNYSRVGFTHPGPAFFYLLALGQGLFFDLIHIVPEQLNGQYLSLSLFTCLCIALSARALSSLLGRVVVAAATTGVLFLFAAHHSLFANNWFPNLYGPPFILLIVAGAALAAGRTEQAPWFVLAGGMLAHGHVSFLLVVGVTALLVALSWWRHHRSGTATPVTRTGVAFALLLIALFLLPVVLQSVVDFPSPWDEYYRYVFGHPKPALPDQYTVWQFYSWYFGTAAEPIWISLVGLVLAVVLLITERDARIRRAMLTCYAMLVLQTLLFFYYVVKGVDSLIPDYRYVGFYFLAVPTLVVTFAVAHLLVRVHSSADRRSLRSTLGLAGGLAIGTAGLVAGAQAPALAATGPLPFQDVPAAVAAVRHAWPGDQMVSINVPLERWPDAAALVLEVRRSGMRVCVDPSSEVLTPFVGEYCPRGAAVWTISVIAAGVHTVPPAKMIWDDGRVAVVRGLPPAGTT